MIRLAASGCRRHGDPADQDRSLRRPQDTRHHADRRGFSGAVGSDETEDFPLFHVEVQMVYRQGVSVPFGQIPQFDHLVISRISIFTLPISPSRSS